MSLSIEELPRRLFHFPDEPHRTKERGGACETIANPHWIVAIFRIRHPIAWYPLESSFGTSKYTITDPYHYQDHVSVHKDFIRLYVVDRAPMPRQSARITKAVPEKMHGTGRACPTSQSDDNRNYVP
jgi:hypothetical protein